jgi:hypothetical protein
MTNGIAAQVVAVVNEWSGKDAAITDTLGKLWDDEDVPFTTAAINLAGKLNVKFHKGIQGSDLAIDTTVDDVIHDVLSL